jgi:hypothetical protein
MMRVDDGERWELTKIVLQSHASSKARWEGKCSKQQKPKGNLTNSVSQELSLKLEKLSANS